MKMKLFHLPDGKAKYAIRKWINRGTAVGFAGGLIASGVLSSLGSCGSKNSNSYSSVDSVVFEKQLTESESESMADSYDATRDEKYSDYVGSGSSSYGNYQGVDISNLNGDVEIRGIQDSGVDFVIVRAFDSICMDYEKDYLSELDQSFIENVNDCVEHNVPFGVYVYSRATTEKMAEQEAVKLIKFLSKYKIRPDYPIYWDIERSEYEPLMDENNNYVDSRKFIGNHPEQVLKNFKAFANVLEKYHYYVGIYTSDSILCEIDPTGEELKDYAVWDAAYKYGEGGKRMDFETEFDGMVGCDYPGDIGMYQFSCTGEMDGVSGTLDCNLSKYNYPYAIHQKELNVPLDYDAYFSNPDMSYKEIVDGEYPRKSKKR